MPSWRLTALTLAAIALAAPTSLAEEGAEPEPFLTITSSDFIDWCEDTMCIRPAMGLYYNRVDGLLYFLGLEYERDESLHPRVRAVRGWSSAREEESYKIDFEQPFNTENSFSAGVSLYRKTSWSREDDEAVGDFGNNLGAFLVRADWRDYFRREGVTAFVRLEATPQLTFRFEHRNDALTSLETKQSAWSVFNRDRDWEENPPLMVGFDVAAREFEGRMLSYFFSIIYDSRNEYMNTGWLARGFLEFSDKWQLPGTSFPWSEETARADYEFRKYVIEVRRYLRLSDSRTLDLLGTWGIGSGTDFPSHKLFYLGGVGNLRGYDRKESAGKNMMFASAEYGVQMARSFQVIYFVDTGAAWFGGGEVSKEFYHDFGVGFRFDAPSIGDLRLDIARAATTAESDVKVYLRLYF